MSLHRVGPCAAATCPKLRKHRSKVYQNASQGERRPRLLIDGGQKYSR